ncbi:MAG TPA: hypothetical protein DHM37_08575 [Candidatus Cloacimonas sp.]|nr:hypothetical protein [Candidatus Cloacimonas sp.]
MKDIIHLVLSFLIFSLLFFSINYFIPFFRNEQEFGKILLKTVIAGIVYSIIVTILVNLQKGKDEEK